MKLWLCLALHFVSLPITCDGLGSNLLSWDDYSFNPTNPRHVQSGWQLVEEESDNVEEVIREKESQTMHILESTNSTYDDLLIESTDIEESNTSSSGNASEGGAEVHNASKGVAEVHNASESVAEVHNASESVAEVHSASEGVAEVHNASEGVAEVHSASEGVAEVHNATILSSTPTNAYILSHTATTVPLNTTALPSPTNKPTPKKSSSKEPNCPVRNESNLTVEELSSRISITLTPSEPLSSQHYARMCYVLLHFASKFWSEYVAQSASFANITFVQTEESSNIDNPVELIFFATDGISGSIIDSTPLVDYVRHYVGAMESETQSQIIQLKVGKVFRNTYVVDPILITGLITACAAILAVCLTSIVVMVFWSRYRKRYYGHWIVNKHQSSVHEPTSWSFENDAFWEDKHRMHTLSVQQRNSVNHLVNTVSYAVPMTVLNGQEREIY